MLYDVLFTPDRRGITVGRIIQGSSWSATDTLRRRHWRRPRRTTTARPSTSRAFYRTQWSSWTPWRCAWPSRATPTPETPRLPSPASRGPCSCLRTWVSSPQGSSPCWLRGTPRCSKLPHSVFIVIRSKLTFVSLRGLGGSIYRSGVIVQASDLI
jgi:hypothetical protein